MAQQTNAQVVAAQLERVVDKIEVLYERGDDTLQLIQKANDVKTVSTRAMRIVLQVTAGGVGTYYDPDGGAFPVGSGESYDVATLTPVFSAMAFQMTSLAQWATDSDEKAIIDETNRIVSEGMLQYRSFLDKQVNASASFVLGTITNIAGTTLTFAVPTGAQLFYEGQQIQFYDTTITNNKSATAGMISTVLIVDPITTQTVVFDQVPATLVNTDVALASGLFGPNPTGIFTIKYHQNNAQTGVWQNLNRATYPVKLQTPRVNGNNGALVPMQPWLAINKIKKSLGLKKVGKRSHIWPSSSAKRGTTRRNGPDHRPLAARNGRRAGHEHSGLRIGPGDYVRRADQGSAERRPDPHRPPRPLGVGARGNEQPRIL